jgi:uncharacterized membrane protein YidH (DUF202 family)
MTDPSRYQRVEDARTKRRGLPRAAWVVILVVAVAVGVVVVMLASGGGHDPSQMNH